MTGRGLQAVGTDLSCLNRTRSGLSLGSPGGGLLTDRTIHECGVGGGGPGRRRTMWFWGAFGRSCFSSFRGAHGESSPRAQIGKVLQLTRPILDKALLADCDDAFPHRAPGPLDFSSPTELTPGYATGMLLPCRIVSKFILNVPGTKRQRYVCQPLLFRSLPTSQAMPLRVVSPMTT